MSNFLKLFSIVLMLLGACTTHAAVDPSSLVKVTKDNNPECIEFYTYKNALYCSTNPTSETSVVDPKIKNYETQTIVFDDRPWQAVWGKQSNEITTVEYIPAGDNINQWHELVTSQFIPGIQDKSTPKQYVDAVIQHLKNSGFDPIVKMIVESPQQVIFEFRIESPDNLKQDELQIVNKGKDGFYIVHYVIKEGDMGESNRQKWLQNLQQTQINQKQHES